MKSRTFTLLAAAVITILYFSSCSDNTSDSLQFNEELQVFTDLEPVEGTNDLIVNLKRGQDVGVDSWFVFNFRNIEPDAILQNGEMKGWCVEWNKPIRANNTDHTDINALSTLNNEKWKDLNYFLNIKDELQEADPELTFRDIQAVIWSLIGIPEFNLDELADADLPTRLLDSNGIAAFSREKVKEIVASVKEGSSDFVVEEGNLFAILLETGDDKQNLMAPVIR
jgi:hypothetical protein